MTTPNGDEGADGVALPAQRVSVELVLHLAPSDAQRVLGGDRRALAEALFRCADYYATTPDDAAPAPPGGAGPGDRGPRASDGRDRLARAALVGGARRPGVDLVQPGRLTAGPARPGLCARAAHGRLAARRVAAGVAAGARGDPAMTAPARDVRPRGRPAGWEIALAVAAYAAAVVVFVGLAGLLVQLAAGPEAARGAGFIMAALYAAIGLRLAQLARRVLK